MSVKRLASDGVLTAFALIIFILEMQLPPLLPIPGIKLGLSNIVTLFALCFLSGKDAFWIVTARILLGAALTGNPAAMLYSLAGGLCCLGVEFLLFFVCHIKPIWAVSAVGAITHNTAQLAVAALVTKTAAVFAYLPFLWAAAILTGLFTGLCITYLAARHKDTLDRLLSK